MKIKQFTHKPVFVAFLVLSLTIIDCGQNTKSVNTKHWVFDYENILTENQEHVLDSIIDNYEKETTNEIVIVTIDSLGDFKNMSDYAVNFGNKFGVGKKDKNNGLIILISSKMKKAWLSTGYGTEKILKDEICKQIVDSSMIPYFKQKDYYGGLKSGLEESMRRWK